MNFDRRHLETFSMLVETRSFGLTARALNITRGSVSQRLVALEGTVGSPLLVREDVVPTQAGEILLHHHKMLAALESETIQRLRPGLVDRFRFAVAVHADALATWFGSVACTLARQNVELDLIVDNQMDVLPALARGEAVGWISSTRASPPGFLVEPLGSMEYACVATPAFIQRYLPSGFSAQDALAAPAVLRARDDPLHASLLDRALGVSVNDQVAHCFPEPNAAWRGIRSGIGYGLVPTMQARELIASGESVPVFSQCEVAVELYWHHWGKAPARDQAVGRSIMQHARRTLKQTGHGR